MTGDKKRYGSLLMQGEHLPRDRHGFPYQVILVLLPGGHGVSDLERDREGRALAWVRDERCEPVHGPDGRPLTEPVPPEVQAEAEEWLAKQRDPDFVPVPWWEPGDRIICSDCGAPLDPADAVPHSTAKTVLPICSHCHDVRQELDALLG